MNAVLFYRGVNGPSWIIVRETFVDAAKEMLRKRRTPCIAVIRRKRRSTGNAWECDDYD